MPPQQELMERVSAADPVPDAEHLSAELQGEADALLERLLAAPPAERPTPARPRAPRLALATVLVAVAAFGAASLLGSDEGPAPNVVSKAVAALTRDDAVYHAEVVAHYRGTDIEGLSGKAYFETWHTAGGRVRHRTFVTRDGRKGRLLTEYAGQRRPGRLGGPALSYDARRDRIYQIGFGRVPTVKGAPEVDPFDPVRSLRELEATGRLRAAGQVEIDGRPAYRLVSGTVEGAGRTLQRSVLLVDAETYLPREQRLFVRARTGATLRVRFRYLVYERLPLNERTETLLDFHPPRGAKCTPGTDKLIRKGSLGFPNPCA
jgi:hypothetical protein